MPRASLVFPYTFQPLRHKGKSKDLLSNAIYSKEKENVQHFQRCIVFSKNGGKIARARTSWRENRMEYYPLHIFLLHTAEYENSFPDF